MPKPDPRRVALVLVDHGSRDADANAVVDSAARELARQGGDRFVAVQAAHMELASPSVDEAFESAVAAGAEVVVVVLFFLGPGRHSTRDIPALAARAAARHPGLRVVISKPLGEDLRLVDLALVRAEEELSRASIACRRKRRRGS
ncbi:MAG: cobalamin biosynthesis protein CbiX [Deltaproteobacteria bacterium]|nr:cobalamin biosynthesis protein CbiX [Deltaproteobacteria bacterium]